MVDDKTNNSEGTPEEEKEQETPQEPSDFGALSGDASDSDLGNLPPLTEFESSEGGAAAGDTGSALPPLDDIDVVTPAPTGGAIKVPPPGYEDVGDFGTPPPDEGLDTPQPAPGADAIQETPQPDLDTPQSDEGTSFQDLMADSDFSPETPEIGPGPESDLETPMFDSAFGEGKDEFAVAADTSAPTQAMETPMFGEDTEGTPVPDFSPDTGVSGIGVAQEAAVPVAPVTPPPEEDKAAAKKAKRREAGGLRRYLAAVVILLVAGTIGILAGPFVAQKIEYLPNPTRAALLESNAKLESVEKRLQTTERELKAVQSQVTDEGPVLTPEQIDSLVAQKESLTKEIETTSTELENLKRELVLIQEDIDLKNEEFVTAKGQYDNLRDQVNIVQARQAGLLAEVDRLQGLVGLLEDANSRRLATKDSLAHAIDRLAILIRESIPLAPEKYAREDRLARVEALRNKVAGLNWVSPDLLSEYTSLYLRELEIAAAREYFFARIPVTSRLGHVEPTYAECLMNGNWSVYYRTFDGKNIGAYQNVAEGGTPVYEFMETQPPAVKKQIEQDIINSRVTGFEEMAHRLAQKELMLETETSLQYAYDSL